MPLSITQLSEIKAFISKRGITFLDVQMEVLDHVATAVEEKMGKNKELSFEEALAKTHASFGIFGFSVIEDSIVKGIDKRFRKLFFTNFLRFFTPQYLLLTILFVFGIYKGLLFLEQYHIPLLILLICLATFYIAYYLIKNKIWKFSKYLLLRISATYLLFFGTFASASSLPNLLLKNNNSSLTPNLECSIISIVSVLFSIYIIAAMRTLSKGLEESKKLKEEYGELDF